MTEPIKYLAQRAARANLKLKDAVYLFEALYQADAIMLAGGNKTKATKLTGQNREAMLKRRKRAEALSDMAEIDAANGLL